MNFENSLIFEKQAEKKENLYEKVEMKINTILDFRKIAENNINQSRDEFAVALNNKLDNVKKELGAEKVAQYDLLQEKILKQFEMDMRIQELSSHLYPELDLDNDGNEGNPEPEILFDEEAAAEESMAIELETLYEESQTISNEIHEMMKDDDLSFLYKLERFIKSMLEKKEETTELLEQIEENGENVSDVLLFGYEPKTPPVIQSSGICINVILSPEDYENQAGRTSSGIHIQDHPINIIKDRPGKESTIRHEENHNISESFVPNVVYVDSFIKGLESKINRMDNDLYPDSFIDHMEKGIEKNIAGYYRQNYYEILADIDRLPGGDMSTFLANYNKAERKIRLFADSIKDKEFSNRLHQKIDEMEANFLTYFNNLSNIFYAANKMGKTEETKALMVLFGNGKGIRKIERQLRHYDGRYDELVLLRRFTGELDYTKDKRGSIFDEVSGINLNKRSKVSSKLGIGFSDLEGLSQIEKLSESMTDKEQMRVVANRMKEMSGLIFEESSEYDFANKPIDDYMEAINILNRIGKNCGVRNRIKLIKSYKSNLFRHYIKQVLDKKDLSEMRMRYAKDFKKFFGTEMMSEGLKTEIKFNFGKYCNKKGQVKNKDLRAFLEENGIETKFVDVVKKTSETLARIMGGKSFDWDF